jgi:hypothetical protein
MMEVVETVLMVLVVAPAAILIGGTLWTLVVFAGASIVSDFLQKRQ